MTRRRFPETPNPKTGAAAPEWKVTPDSKTRSFEFSVTPGFGHALLSPLVASAFRFLRVSASVTTQGLWWSLSNAPDLIPFEVEHGSELARYRYNDRCLSRVLGRGEPLLGEHAGHCDWFVPIRSGAKVLGVLVSGPFLRARPTSAYVLQRWREMTGRQGHAADPAFAAFLVITLGTLVLDPGQIKKFGEFLGCLASLMAGDGAADELASRADKLRAELQSARVVESAWDAVESMLDERSPRVWSSAHRTSQLQELGLSRIADHVLVGLCAAGESDIDGVDEAVRRDALQRGVVEFARELGNTTVGRVGDHGVVFLSATKSGGAKDTSRSLELAERVQRFARRRFGLSLHFGASVALGSVPLSRSYQAALAAAESALVQDQRLVVAGPNERQRSHSLTVLRRELARTVEQRPELLPARFDRYLEAVAVECGYRTEVARGYLESGFERMAEPLVGKGELDEKSFGALSQDLERASAGARTVSDLFAAYRRAAQDFWKAARAPVPARHDRSIRRAIEHIRTHYTERLSIQSVARAAGFAPNYFSKLFKKREGKAFAKYVTSLRIERARLLLDTTDWEVRRVAERSGFNSLEYFARVFLREVGKTPSEYRERSEKPPKLRTS